MVGLLNTDNQLAACTFETTIDMGIVIACIDDFLQSRNQPMVLVVDNAKIHTSDAFVAKMPYWKAIGLEIVYLPVYSPQLNRIEILWRQMKYYWLPFSAYLSFSHLVELVESILKHFGVKYKFNFL